MFLFRVSVVPTERSRTRQRCL